MPSPLRDQKTPKKGQDTFSNLTKMPGSWTTRSLAGVSREAAAGDGADEHRLRDLGSLASGPSCVGLGFLLGEREDPAVPRSHVPVRRKTTLKPRLELDLWEEAREWQLCPWTRSWSW